MYLLKLHLAIVTFCFKISFTFHHVSIKTKDQDRKIDLGLSFTFHHVSIKTFMRRIANVRGYNSHSTMYLLKREGIEDEKTIDNDSHSTMYLLKPVIRIILYTQGEHSHSTMYLLKLYSSVAFLVQCTQFTFHHVSIKTSIAGLFGSRFSHSHSTMYLLKQEMLKPLRVSYSIHIPPCIY